MSFVVDQELPKKSITVAPESSPYYAELEITCSPISTSVSMVSHRYPDSNGIITNEILDADITEELARNGANLSWVHYYTIPDFEMHP